MESWIDSYFESLAKVDTEIGESEALALKRSNFPEALYRYRSLERLEYRLEELRDGYVFLSNPADFNDPYDSAFSIRTGHPARYFDLLRNLVSVSCFATNPNSVVMWSHYANQHTGICVEFSGSSILSSERLLELVHPVRYTEEFFESPPQFEQTYRWRIALEKIPRIMGIRTACRKSKEWGYEEEWRLVSLYPASGPKFFLDSCGIKPSRIILGARIDQPNQAAIKELAEKISVPVIKARLAHV